MNHSCVVYLNLELTCCQRNPKKSKILITGQFLDKMRIRLLIFCTLNYFISSLVSLSIHRNDTLDLQTSSSSPDLSLNTTSPSVSVSVKHQPFHEYHDHPDDSLWTEDAIRFNNHKLYSILIEKDEEKVEKLRSLRDKMDIDFWNEPELGKKINFRVSPLYQEDVEKYLNSTSLMYEIITDDLQKWIDRERKENRECDFLSGRQDASNFQLDHYHTLEEVSPVDVALYKRSCVILCHHDRSMHTWISWRRDIQMQFRSSKSEPHMRIMTSE